jgi:hypothetical protein
LFSTNTRTSATWTASDALLQEFRCFETPRPTPEAESNKILVGWVKFHNRRDCNGMTSSERTCFERKEKGTDEMMQYSFSTTHRNRPKTFSIDRVRSRDVTDFGMNELHTNRTILNKLNGPMFPTGNNGASCSCTYLERFESVAEG